MNFPSINIQGNILSGEMLEKIRNEELKDQTPASFGFDKQVKVRDEIGLAWSAVRGLWQTFRMRLERIAPDDSGTTETRNFWMLPFFTTLGYDVEKSVAEVIDNKTYAVSHRAANLDGFPIHIAGFNDSLDKRRDSGGPRLSPHALVQEYLNKTENHLYAIVTNGRHLRLLRDATRLVRMAYIEFDLEKMIEEELFADFALLFRLLHASRMPKQSGEGEDSIIEQYHQESLEAGGRIREKLSDAVEYAIRQLGNGFLQHPANEELRRQASGGTISPDDFYLYSLRLVYRMLFLLVIEDRGLVYPDKLDDEAKKRRAAYLDFYSINRLRRMAERKIFVEGSKHDLWENLKVAFRIFEQQQYGSKLNILPLGAGIFHPEALGSFTQCKLSNEHLLEVMQRICYFHDPERKLMVKVNYGDLDVEEFGSVYEGLLEFKPVFDEVEGRPRFSFRAGTGRSSSGSHYTPEELVRPLIRHSLDYIISDCLTKPHERLKMAPGELPLRKMQEQALLAITVCDISCGSGHILLSAARRIAIEVARVRTGEDQPSPEAMRHAIRDTIRNCIYGVDINPLAVELCKVALWLEAHNPGEPLNFLDHRIKCGDSIVGLAHRHELENGIADEAFKTLPGDDNEVAAAFRKQNKSERIHKGQQKIDFAPEIKNELDEVVKKFKLFENLPERTPQEIAAKARAHRDYEKSVQRTRLKQMADAQVAQFFIPKTPETKHLLITDYDYRNLLRQVNKGIGSIQERRISYASEVISAQKRFFHWFIEFPEVFSQGGFNCVLGNPPFLGGLRISTNYGASFLHFITTYFQQSGGTSDLVSYFFRRAFILIKPKCFISLIGTNTISQGDTRKTSLDFIVELGDIIFANPSIRWPGVANLDITLISIVKTKFFKLKKIFRNKFVDNISSQLDDSTEGFPYSLSCNQDKAFIGSFFLGEGFLLNIEEKKQIESDHISNEVIYPLINGNDINEHPSQETCRYIINFKALGEDDIKIYKNAYERVFKQVKPIRDQLQETSSTNVRRKKYWWQYAASANSLYDKNMDKTSVFVTSQTSKYLNFTMVPNNYVFAQSLCVFSFSNYFEIIFLQSTFHAEWVNKFGATLGKTLRYTPTDCFHNFPILYNLSTELQEKLNSIGFSYENSRRQLMLSMQLGLTKTYNAFHAPEVQPGITTAALQGKDKKAIEKQYGKEVWNLWNHLQKTPGTCTIEEAIAGIQKLRELHVEMDNAVLEAYGWAPPSPSGEGPGVRLKHDFYEVDYLPENDRIRYTIHPDARKEVLKRLLQLNHQYFEEEARQGLHKEETVRKFYEQKGTPIPEEVSKWFRKGKEAKKPKTTKANAKEADGGYGNLFTD